MPFLTDLLFSFLLPGFASLGMSVQHNRGARHVRRFSATVAASLILVASANAAEQPWASCPNGNDVNTDTAFGAPHLAGYSGSLSPALLQAAGFVALTLPEQR